MTRTPDTHNISGGQKQLTDFLVKLGLIVESEKNIGKYRVDCYLPELKMVLEFDGPYLNHTKPQDARRDEDLRTLGVEMILHVKDMSLSTRENIRRMVGAE